MLFANRAVLWLNNKPPSPTQVDAATEGPRNFTGARGLSVLAAVSSGRKT